MSRLLFTLVLLLTAAGASAQQRTLGATAIDKTAAFRGQLGRRVSYVCPAAVPLTAALWGTDVYSDDSPVCLAAIHSGALQAGAPGVVTVAIAGAVASLQGSTRNGVTSRAYASHTGSFTFETAGVPGQVEWTTTGQGLPAGFATPIVVSCPAQGSSTAKIWGTDTYTEDSAICVAAVHAGVITAAAGGLVAVSVAPGQQSYAASERNGVASQAYRALGSSFRVAAPPPGAAFIGPAAARQAVTAVAPPAPPPEAFIGPPPVRQATESVAPPPEPAAACGGGTFADACVAAVDPASIRVSWVAHADATHYRIYRGAQLLATLAAGERAFVDETLLPGATAAYTVEAVRATGTIGFGSAPPRAARTGDAGASPTAGGDTVELTQFAALETTPSRSATTPTLAPPVNVTAQSIGGPKGRVRVAWAPVAGANGYLVYRDGNPLPIDSAAGTTNSTYDSGVPLGRHRYQVEALFTTAVTRRTVNGPASAEAFAEVAFPRPPAPFLSLQGGPAGPEELDSHYRTRCGPEGALLDINRCAIVTPMLDAHSNFTANWAADLSGPPAGFAGRNWALVTFADVNVLGLGRRVNCAPRREPAGPILCWATSHGSIPAPGSTVNGPALARAGEQVQDVKSLNVILAYPDGRTFFGTWEKSGANSGVSAFDREFNLARDAQVRFGTPLDTQGVKPVPHVCLSCHGGRYDPQSRMVRGASLLPLVPAQLEFSSPQARASQEEAIREINSIVLASNPAPAIVEQINALYGGAPQTPGARANDAAVPAGWRTEPNIYKQVIEPYCASCHFSRQGPLALASVADARSLRVAIQNTTCSTYTMPHSEQQFRRFWTEGGVVSLPGLLSTWLGFGTCGP